jgi:hypothetical protein
MLNVANFSVSGALTGRGQVLPRLLFNVPQLGGLLEQAATCTFEMFTRGAEAQLIPEHGTDIAWPTPRIQLS